MVKALTILEEILPEYIDEVKNKHQENAKAMAFSSFIQKVFDVESKDLDFEVPVKSEAYHLRGRIDAVFGNLIIEFKKDLESSVEKAKQELQLYFQSYFEKYHESDILGIANDGIRFKVFYPVFENDKVVQIQEIDELNLENTKPYDVFLWFDSYLFANEKITPTSSDIKKRFGLESPTYKTVARKLEKLFEKAVLSHKPSLIKYESWARYLEVVYGERPKDKQLFFVHTYLSTLVKLIVHVKISGEKKTFDDIRTILFGRTFENFGIKNFIEEDFFSWILAPTILQRTREIFEDILQQIRVYDFDKIDEDVLKELYQELVDPTTRHDLGEFYTPDWLAEYMIMDILKSNPAASVMDPSCGSGTFLFKTIQYKIRELSKQGWNKNKILEHVINDVIGFDIHPLAVIIARTNYLLALRDLLQYRRTEIIIPVYMSDSLKIPKRNMDVSQGIEVYEFEAMEKKFQFPVSVASDMSKMDNIIKMLREYGQDFELKIENEKTSKYGFRPDEFTKNMLLHFEKMLSQKYHKDEAPYLRQNLVVLYDLINQQSDAIWPYVLRNMYKPVAVSFKKVDVIIGNPPWLTLSKMKNILYQDFLKELSMFYRLIEPKKTHNIPHIELATLFFCKCVDQYLKEDAKIAFVMPKAVLVASQHKNFLKFEKPKIMLDKIYDLEIVEPLFNVPCCVLFGRKNGVTKYPVNTLQFEGKLENKNDNWFNAEKILKVTKSTYEPVSLDTKPSDYYDMFTQGATIVPRNFFFVTPVKHSFLGINLSSPMVRSDEKNETKPPWSKITVEGEVESKFLFYSVLGSDLVPFGTINVRMVVLPIIIENGIPNVCNSYLDLQNNGYSKASKYFERVEKHWHENSTVRQKNTTIYSWLNYRNKISVQNLNVRYNVLYTASSTYLASCVIDQKENRSMEGIKLNGFLAESKTYYFETDNSNEANYLCAFLNSKTIDQLIKPTQTHGLWGYRDIHKRPLSLPIPLFNAMNKDHLRLAELGELCSTKVKSLTANLKYSKIGKIRTDIRNSLKNELDEISKITKKIILEIDPALSEYLK